LKTTIDENGEDEEGR